jgi:hypothetical protein
MAYSVQDMLVVVLLLHLPGLLQSLRRIYFHLLRPIGEFPPFQEFDSRGCVAGSRTILLDMSRPGCRVCRSRCRIVGSRICTAREDLELPKCAKEFRATCLLRKSCLATSWSVSLGSCSTTTALNKLALTTSAPPIDITRTCA